jgi:hypothetical protein
MKLYSKNALSCLFSRNSQGTRHHENPGAKKIPPAIFEPLEPRILLSADLTFGGGDTALDLDLRLDPVDSSILQLLDNTTDTVIDTLALTGSNTVEITGSTLDDSLHVDLDSPSAIGLNIVYSDANTGDSDTLFGPASGSLWDISGNDSGTVNSISFAGIENLTGAANSDVFVFQDSAGVSGLVDGGAGSDTLDLSAGTGGVTVDLASGTATVAGLIWQAALLQLQALLPILKISSPVLVTTPSSVRFPQRSLIQVQGPTPWTFPVLPLT